MRKAFLFGVAFLLIGTSTSFAEYEGTFQGTGKGYCYPYESLIIYPFQTWQGELTVTEDDGVWLFEGTWQDNEGNHGTLKDCKLQKPHPSASYLWSFMPGSWYWLETVNGVEVPRFGGQFCIGIDISTEESPCDGFWFTHEWPPSWVENPFEGHRVP